MNRRLTLLMAVGLWAWGSAQAELRELSFMTAMPVVEQVVVDGKLDEGVWKKGVANGNYFRPRPTRRHLCRAASTA